MAKKKTKALALRDFGSVAVGDKTVADLCRSQPLSASRLLVIPHDRLQVAAVREALVGAGYQAEVSSKASLKVCLAK